MTASYAHRVEIILFMFIYDLVLKKIFNIWRHRVLWNRWPWSVRNISSHTAIQLCRVKKKLKRFTIKCSGECVCECMCVIKYTFLLITLLLYITNTLVLFKRAFVFRWMFMNMQIDILNLGPVIKTLALIRMFILMNL